MPRRLASYYYFDYCFSSVLPILTLKRAGFFGSDWWPATSSAESEGAVFSVLISGGSRRSPAPKERGAMRSPALRDASK
jgi:hypothetical protein